MKRKNIRTNYILAFMLIFTQLSAQNFTQLSAQNFKERFNELLTKNDTTGQVKLLIEWEKSDINDPELYIANFNHFVGISKKEVIRFDNKSNGNDVLQINSQDPSVKEPVGYLNGDVYYNPEILEKGYSAINKGIAKYPDRLDMRFGKIYMYGQSSDFKNFTSEIIKTIEYSTDNKNKWKWSNDESIDDAQVFMLTSIQDYQNQLYDAGNPASMGYMKQIAEAILKHYPDHVESLSNLSVVFMIKQEYDKALEYLMQAVKLRPEDDIVLSNIAHVYKEKGDKSNAIKYYELVAKVGSEGVKKYAMEQIEELKK